MHWDLVFCVFLKLNELIRAKLISKENFCTCIEIRCTFYLFDAKYFLQLMQLSFPISKDCVLQAQLAFKIFKCSFLLHLYKRNVVKISKLTFMCQ